jgi:hypothetical protein
MANNMAINESKGKSWLPKFLTNMFDYPSAAPNITEKLPSNAPNWMPKMLTNVLEDKPLSGTAPEFVPAVQRGMNPQAPEFVPLAAQGGRRSRRRTVHRKRKLSHTRKRKSSHRRSRK